MSLYRGGLSDSQEGSSPQCSGKLSSKSQSEKIANFIPRKKINESNFSFNIETE